MVYGDKAAVIIGAIEVTRKKRRHALWPSLGIDSHPGGRTPNRHAVRPHTSEFKIAVYHASHDTGGLSEIGGKSPVGPGIPSPGVSHD